MKRTVIHIDEEKCTGCRLCVDACHEGAIGMVGGKARLLRDDYCDGLGDCLPACPTGAITFVEREAAPYDEHAVARHLAARAAAEQIAEDDLDRTIADVALQGCPGSCARSLATDAGPTDAVPSVTAMPSRLMQWPAQIKLVPTQAPYYNGHGLLIAADCTAFACASFHERFMRGNVTIIGCPKLDEGSYADKLATIIAANDITSVTVARMEVPCCGGLERAAAEAHARSGKDIPFEVVTFSVTGDVIG
ncbi:4Fe-4S binding protein [Adlercreutzia sp. R25]|uniref:4Fe-4S binding protein n=1 Tax=Adlercreutzia shanghongiae TaxID=3111773 RepID=A0ABU6IZ34_9ACTN|nr:MULTISPECIES: 4Fe-4S binding protein [unclassified Adlercreutzia]MEC4272784.1 4Fe-4S binding protein [Adlercreutzia sp. R25]MEC4295098.1 4Fe-4S binding protein [Adlercreutzia sp. R22]